MFLWTVQLKWCFSHFFVLLSISLCPTFNESTGKLEPLYQTLTIANSIVKKDWNHFSFQLAFCRQNKWISFSSPQCKRVKHIMVLAFWDWYSMVCLVVESNVQLCWNHFSFHSIKQLTKNGFYFQRIISRQKKYCFHYWVEIIMRLVVLPLNINVFSVPLL